MAVDSEFVAHVVELLDGFGDVNARRMFGGYGIFRDGLMFALIADDELYFKVDERNRPAFEALDLKPFVYRKKGRDTSLAYYRAPEDALDDPDEAVAWARPAFDAALRAAAAKSTGTANNRGRKK